MTHANKQLTHLIIQGYKSIDDCQLSLTNLNVLIGANGAGKSNFIGFFRFLSNVLDKQLQLLVGKSGGPDAILHFGRKQTEQLNAKMTFDQKHYQITLEPTADNRMVFRRETVYLGHLDSSNKYNSVESQGYFESQVDLYESNDPDNLNPLNEVIKAIRHWQVYHFHDTSDSAKVKQIHRINDNAFLRHDGANLAAFLYRIQKHHDKDYQRIVKTIQMVSPYFGDFHLRPTLNNSDSIELEWTERGQDFPFKASDLSDGTLRFIMLTTVLLQPQQFMPLAIIIDEPELGLHPYAINILAALISSASHQQQLIVSTQSVELVNEFDVADLVVVDKKQGASTFTRLDEQAYDQWLEDYSLGELWQKNIIGGRPQA